MGEVFFTKGKEKKPYVDLKENENTQEINTYDNIPKGHLKIFIGYAPGVGKTFTMLNEGNRRLKRGEDIVIGYVDTYGRSETIAQIDKLEIIPPKKIEYEKKIVDEMDTDAIIARNPETVLITSLEHVNVSGSKNKRRYMDIQEIIDKGINVITTLNIQHLESLNDIVKQITGVTVKETVPDSIVARADEVVVVDVTPEALQNRLKRGDIISNMEEVPEALKTFFRKGNLSALRELVLRETAEEVEDDVEEYMKEKGIKDNWATAEKIMICITTSAAAKNLIRKGARLAHRYKCDWYVVTVNCTNRFAKKLSLRGKQILHSHFELAKRLGAQTVVLEGESVSEQLVKWANENHITQLFIGYPRRTKLETLLRGSTVNKLIEKINNVDIHLIATDRDS